MAKRLAADPPEPSNQAAEPIDDISTADVEVMIQQTHAQISAYRKSIPTLPPVPEQPPHHLMATATQSAPRPAASA